MNFGNWTVGQNVRLKSMAVLWVDNISQCGKLDIKEFTTQRMEIKI